MKNESVILPRGALQSRIDELGRIQIAHLPTPLEFCPRLTEAIILDPVYTSKAMAGLIDHIRQGRIGKNEVVVFLHTGGTPALFAYAEDLELATIR